MNIDFLLAFTKLFATYDNGKSVAIQAICYEYHNVKLKVSNSEIKVKHDSCIPFNLNEKKVLIIQAMLNF